MWSTSLQKSAPHPSPHIQKEMDHEESLDIWVPTQSSPWPNPISPPPHAEFLADNPVFPYAVHVVMVRSDLMVHIFEELSNLPGK